MATLKHNITGKLTQELLAVGDGIRVSSVLLSNIHASDSVTVALYIEKKLTGRFYIVKALVIPYGVSVLLDSSYVNFDNTKVGYALHIQLSASDSAVDITIK